VINILGGRNEEKGIKGSKRVGYKIRRLQKLDKMWRTEMMTNGKHTR
jgi:hypothetical protein